LVRTINSEINIDGIGDEIEWSKSKWGSNFWMWRPTDSLQAKKQTRFKLIRNDKYLFILIESDTDGKNFNTPNLKRDFSTYPTDYLTLLFDTFNDGTNAFSFATNPIGLKADGLISGGNQNYRTDRNYAWDTKWNVATQINENSFIAEIRIPFSSFFYDNSQQFWRFNIYRGNTQINESSTWIKIPQNQLIGNLAFMGKMVFETPLEKGKNPISLIPYLSSAAQNDFIYSTSKSNISLGGDAKIPIGNALNLDLTFNPDFSQVEVDDQVVNLTRFAISLPEKRQFFTQNDDLFKDFGENRDVIPFFSRRIGVAQDLDGNTIENKIMAGARLSGKLNSNLRLGFLNMLTESDVNNQIASNLNTVFTLRQKVFDRSNISFFLIDRRTIGEYDFINKQDKKNSVSGVEYNLASPDSKWVGRAFYHKSFTEGLEGDDQIVGMRIQRNTLRNRISTGFIHGGEDFRSDLGFFRRTGFMKITPEYTYRIYPKNPNVNNYSFTQRGFFVYDTSRNYLMTDRVYKTTIRKSFLNSSSLSFEYNNRYVYLTSNFDPTRTPDGTKLPSNIGYRYDDAEFSYRSDQRKRLNFDSKISYGTFYNGTKFTLENEIKWRKQPILNASMIINFNSIVLPNPYPSKNIWLISPKIDFTFTKTLTWITFVQYNSQGENLGINSRMQWRFSPLSDLFLVYNDNYISTDNFSPRNRSFNLKLTYWLNI
tara:strand:+ start:13975 stop:16101 length:2127 start_codon:yes stop_codon:yes gene_type:complete